VEEQGIFTFQTGNTIPNLLVDSIPLKSFAPLVDNGYAQERQSNAGRRISINFPDAAPQKPAWRDEPLM
jgi:hypothetical protein